MNSIQIALIVGAFTASGLAIIVLRLVLADLRSVRESQPYSSLAPSRSASPCVDAG